MDIADGHQLGFNSNMWIIEYFKSVGLVLLIQVITVIIGLYFLFTQKVSKTIKLYIYLIASTMFIEFLGLYAALGYFSNYKYLPFIEGTRFAVNFWMYNIFEVFSISFLLYYFGRLLPTRKLTYVLLVLGIAFVVSSVIVFIINADALFNQTSIYVTITGVILLLIAIGFYLIELLKGKILLKGQDKFPLFVAISVGIAQLAISPFLIYSNYYHSAGDEEFIALYIRALQIINVIVYLIIISGFFVCLSKKNT